MVDHGRCLAVPLSRSPYCAAVLTACKSEATTEVEALNFSAIFHQFATWTFRAAIAGGIVGVIYLAMRGDVDMPGAQLVAAQRAMSAAEAVPCQPIGQTATGELVYSMDCETLPAAAPALGPAANAN